MFALVMLGLTASPRVQASLNTASITCPGEVRIGVMFSCKVTGLTVGTNYIVTAQHSDGNVSVVKTAGSSTEYFRFTLNTEDSDNLVPISVGQATDAGALSGADIDTALVTLINPSSDIPSTFFQNMLSPVLIIGIFVMLMGAFFIHRRRK